MLMVLLGAIFFIASIVLKVGPQFTSQRIQCGLAIAILFASICLLFRQPSIPNAGSNKTRYMFLGFSVLIPIAATGLLYNNFIPQLLGTDEPFEGLYSFLLWSALAIPSIHIWGQFLRLASIISPEEAQSFWTWRTIKPNQHQNP